MNDHELKTKIHTLIEILADRPSLLCANAFHAEAYLLALEQVLDIIDGSANRRGSYVEFLSHCSCLGSTYTSKYIREQGMSLVLVPDDGSENICLQQQEQEAEFRDSWSQHIKAYLSFIDGQNGRT